jgi:hypothetical protein
MPVFFSPVVLSPSLKLRTGRAKDRPEDRLGSVVVSLPPGDMYL